MKKVIMIGAIFLILAVSCMPNTTGDNGTVKRITLYTCSGEIIYHNVSNYECTNHEAITFTADGINYKWHGFYLVEY